MRTPQPRLPHYLVEWYVGDLGEATLREMVGELESAVDAMSAAGLPVRLVTTIAVPEDDFVFALFAATAAPLVAEVCERVARPPIRVTEALLQRPAAAGLAAEGPRARQM